MLCSQLCLDPRSLAFPMLAAGITLSFSSMPAASQPLQEQSVSRDEFLVCIEVWCPYQHDHRHAIQLGVRCAYRCTIKLGVDFLLNKPWLTDTRVTILFMLSNCSPMDLRKVFFSGFRILTMTLAATACWWKMNYQSNSFSDLDLTKICSSQLVSPVWAPTRWDPDLVL